VRPGWAGREPFGSRVVAASRGTVRAGVPPGPHVGAAWRGRARRRDDTTAGPFRRRPAKARLDRLFPRPPAAAAFADPMADNPLAAQAS